MKAVLQVAVHAAFLNMSSKCGNKRPLINMLNSPDLVAWLGRFHAVAYAFLLMVLVWLLPQSGFAQIDETEEDKMVQEGWEKWQLLAQVEYNEQYVEEVGGNILFPIFPESIKAMEGKTIVLTGYVIPLEETGDQNYFMFSSRPYNSCYFCGGAGPESVAEVYAGEQVPYTEEPVTIRGRLDLNGEDYNHLMYQLRNASIVAK